MKRLTLAVMMVLFAAPAFANSGAEKPKQVDWAFDGVFGRFDKPSVQRGFQVYKEVCSACHSLKRVAFRDLTKAGFSAAEVKSLAATYQVKDGPNDMGDMYERPGRPSDKIPGPYANDAAARAANGGGLPPDLSLIIKAREDGANYVYSLLTSYGQTPPEGHEMPQGTHYNPYFPGGAIKMPQPLHNDQVTYQDGTNGGLEQEAKDVVNFLQWAAEPEMEQRKHTGIHVIIFLSIMTAFFYVTKKRIWSDLH